MVRLSAARRAALALLGEARRSDARVRELMRGRGAGEFAGLSERDRGLAARLVMGVTGASGALDLAIDQHLARGRGKLEPRVRDALRISVFELLYLGTRADVAVSQGVELVRSVAPRAAGLANAVLHRVAEKDVPALEVARARVASGDVNAADLARVGALPEWLCAQALDSLGAVRAAAWARRALEPAGAWVAANRARHGADAAAALLDETGCAPQLGPLPGSFLLGEPSALTRSRLVAQADIIPCDLAAQEVVLGCAPRPGERVLEVGQGRGTKTLLLEGAACAAGGPCEVVGVEVSERKSKAARWRMEAAGVADHVRCIAADGRALDGELGDELGTFDLVFVDVPCSGTGTLARHPEIAWSLEPDAPAALAQLQGELLAAAAARVAPGGRLVYATCSILAQENEQVVEGLLTSAAGAGFSLERSGLTTERPDADTHFSALLRRA